MYQDLDRQAAKLTMKNVDTQLKEQLKLFRETDSDHRRQEIFIWSAALARRWFNHHKKPHKAFEQMIEQANHLVRTHGFNVLTGERHSVQ